MKTKTDFIVYQHGTVWLLRAVTKAARLFIEEHVHIKPWQGTPAAFTADWRPARDLVEALIAEDFVLEAH
jgi:hypothetical protein